MTPGLAKSTSGLAKETLVWLGGDVLGKLERLGFGIYGQFMGLKDWIIKNILYICQNLKVS